MMMVIPAQGKVSTTTATNYSFFSKTSSAEEEERSPYLLAVAVALSCEC
jgi:hypothetical protein